ncbi:DNA cytosine methyltransferase [Gluconacetobacter azotocaptans]|uniref:DNA cytosine methyltransferase n=1 Tax=Gluconacetobacter azotocaptans TaxID=142834 RepID=UPI00195807BF|nr:DNA cytosine methyltransferase [Gluconacetobacter azotocaptans]MBM9401599.1 DNA cytosine methyltransferase [Gluconacetobacter azotocaptans]
MLTCDDLFSCVGGHALGLHAAGPIQTIRFVEADAWRRKVIAHHFPGISIYDDVHTAPTGMRADILVGGPPCQRTSALSAVHGYRTGHSLWSAMLHHAQHGHYGWIVVEQPASAGRTWFAQVQADLEATGRRVRRLDLTAFGLGAPHTRPRMFAIAHCDVSRLEIAWQAGSREADRIARGTASGNVWISGPPRGLRVADGIPGGLDGYSVGRQRRIEAIGDSNPPAMMTAIGRAILSAEGFDVATPPAQANRVTALDRAAVIAAE